MFNYLLLATTETATKTLFNKPIVLLYALILIVITVIIIKFFKNIIVNSIIGVVGLFITNFIFGLKLPFVVTLIVTAILGPAGLGIMLVLRFFGLV
ncbi:MAG: hypothetical protein WCY27_01075 [archaeon]|jgi:hypothetical protein|nr:hypothetical protein [archaeon]MDD2477994.1 hypothetical protein [Candidatus ainarchaeum sp.]MDD3084868.1 hypothetical protein [Candidatus ainarchaeum sp.]MDD4221148.1 hypothetical protein [Candidatus ainarchaeum sp.]MDD4662979.1 hypothetical protein [Candidatus ainarchaeum sp.]